MKKILSSLDEATGEMAQMKRQEAEFCFSKKQYLAYELSKLLKDTDFIEIKFLGVIEDYESWLKEGHYFDVKTPQEDYTNAQIYKNYNKTQNQNYFNRVYNEIGFEKLGELSAFFDKFIEENSQLQYDVYKQMQNRPFTPNYKSILKSLMSEGEYSEWLILSEQKNLSVQVGNQTHNQTKPSQKKI